MELRHTQTEKNKLRSFAEVAMAGIMLKTYMAMSNLWLLADKMKKATTADTYVKPVKAGQPVLKTQM